MEQYTYRHTNNIGTNVAGYELIIEPTSVIFRTIIQASVYESAKEFYITKLKVHESVPDRPDYIYLDEVTFTLDDLRAFNNLDDVTAYSFSIDQRGRIARIYNRLAETFSSRSRFYEKRYYPTELQSLLIYVPFSTATFDDCKFKVTLRNDEMLLSNKDFVLDNEESHSPTNNVVFPDKWMPTVLLEGPNTVPANGIATYTVKVIGNDGLPYDKQVSVYLDSNSGYIPIRKLDVLGETTFKFHALGLESGNSVRLKAGFRWYNNLTYKDIQVI